MEFFMKSQDPSPLHKLLDSQPEIDYIRYQWLDYAGVLRQRILTKPHCLDLIAKGHQHGVGSAGLRSITIGPSDTWSYLRQEVIELRPDWTSLRICHYAPGHAQVMCFAYFKNSPTPLANCPRFALVRALERLHTSNHSMLIGFEIEFTLLTPDLQIPTGPDNAWTWATASGLRDRKLTVLEEVISLLHQSSIPVQTFHTEVPPQLEFSTGPSNPLSAIDSLIYTHELLRCVAIRHNYRATLTPKPTHLDTINTCHTHFSIEPPESADAVLAAILNSLPLLIPFSLPHYDSYHVIRDKSGKAGLYIGYGTENRDLPIRKIGDNHFEYRPCDCTANFYLFIALLIQFGLDGVDEQMNLDGKWKDVRFWPSYLSEEDRREVGLVRRMPTSLQEAVAGLKEGRGKVEGVLGQEIVDAYVRMKETECGLSKMGDEERRGRYMAFF